MTIPNPRATVHAVAAFVTIIGAMPSCGNPPASVTAPPHGTQPPKEVPLEIAGGTLRGSVVGSDGRPVSGAVVAVRSETEGIGFSWRSSEKLAVTDDEGRFEIVDLEPASYAITATSAGTGTAHVGAVNLGDGSPTAPVRLRIKPGGVDVRGSVRDAAGTRIAGAMVRSIGDVNSVGHVYLTRTDDRGEFKLALPATDYWIRAEVPGRKLRSGSRRTSAGERTGSIRFTAWAQGDDAPKEVVEWVRETAIKIATPRHGHGYQDLEGLLSVVGDARLVGLGEATHGTREVFQMKHRLLEFLVARLGFSVFMIEENYTHALALNDYVLTGVGNPEDLLAGGASPWRTQELLELVRWMRAYNDRHRSKVKLLGYDCQSPGRDARAVLAYLR